jgi:hypothetical protein
MSPALMAQQADKHKRATRHATVAWCGLCAYPILLFVVFVVLINVSAVFLGGDVIESNRVVGTIMVAMAVLAPVPALWPGILAARAGSRSGLVAGILAGILLVGGLVAVILLLSVDGFTTVEGLAAFGLRCDQLLLTGA